MAPNAPLAQVDPDSLALVHVPRAQPILARSFDEVRGISSYLADPREGTTLLPMHLRGSAASVALIIMRGSEVGLPPGASMDLLYMTPAGRIGMFVKAKLAVVMARDLVEDLKELERTELIATYEVKRRGKWSCRRSYTIENARAAGLVKTSGAWIAQPANMLQWKALGLCLEFLFPDVLSGLGDEYDVPTYESPSFVAPSAPVVAAASVAVQTDPPRKTRRQRQEAPTVELPPQQQDDVIDAEVIDHAEPQHASERSAADAFQTTRDEMETQSPPAKSWPRSEGSAPPAQPFRTDVEVAGSGSPVPPPVAAHDVGAISAGRPEREPSAPSGDPPQLIEFFDTLDAIKPPGPGRSPETVKVEMTSLKSRARPWTRTAEGSPFATRMIEAWMAKSKEYGL